MGKRTGRPTGRPQSGKVFNMDIEISTTKKDVGAYTIKHLESGKVYHGSTNNLYRRVNEHQKDLKANKHRNKDLQKVYNDGGLLKLFFTETETKEDAVTLEQKLMDETPIDLMFNKSLNAKNTVTGLWENPSVAESFKTSKKGNQNAKGNSHTEEWKKEASKRMTGNKHLLGHKHSDAAKQKMSKAHKGRKLSEEHIRKASLGRITGTVTIGGVEYESRSEASRVLGMALSTIRKRCSSDKHPDWIYKPKEKCS